MFDECRPLEHIQRGIDVSRNATTVAAEPETVDALSPAHRGVLHPGPEPRRSHSALRDQARANRRVASGDSSTARRDRTRGRRYNERRRCVYNDSGNIDDLVRALVHPDRPADADTP